MLGLRQTSQYTKPAASLCSVLTTTLFQSVAIMPFPNTMAGVLLALAPRIVGATFLWTGAIKAIAPHTFYAHLSTLGWIPRPILSAAVTAAAGFEAAWGLALLTGMAPGVVLPATVVLLALLSAVSWWGVRSGRATDCGCYGGYVQPSIGQSVALNLFFAVLVGAAWMGGATGLVVEAWQTVAVVGATLIFATLTETAQRYSRNNGRPMFDTTPLRVGRRWRNSWADGATSAIGGEVLVAFLGPDCPYCAQWVKVGNAIVQSPRLPRVVGVVAASGERVGAFVDENQVRFPLATISRSLMGRLTQAVPTTVLVEAGRIQKVWVGQMSPEFVDRFKQAFFPQADEKFQQVHTASAGTS